MNLKPLVNNPEIWSDLLQELDNRIKVCYKKLEQVTDPIDMYQTQGEIKALRSLEKLRDKVNAK